MNTLRNRLARAFRAFRETPVQEPPQKKLKRPTRTFPEFFAHLKKAYGFNPGCCIDVGAAKGTKTIYEAFPEALHVVFEPLPDFHEELAAVMTPFKHEIHHCALMEEAGDRSLLRHRDHFGSSLMHKCEPGAKNLVDVPVRTLDDVMSERIFPGGLLLKTDCQGSDLFVLRGGEETLKKADVVIVEASLFRFWGAHHPDLFDIMKFMHAREFSLYDVLDGLYRPSDGALGQLDLAFVRANGRFRQSSKW